MPLQYNHLSRQSRRVLRRAICPEYLNGECYAFAIALHRGLGWPIVGIMHGDVPCHAGVRSPEGMIYDVRGPVSDEKFAEDINGLSRPFEIREITTEALLAQRPVSDGSIMCAARMAQVFWPNLGWKEDTQISRTRAFVEELERISRKHGVWIRAPYPTAKPVLTVGYGDEKGYSLEPSDTCSEYFIDRLLGGD